MVILSMKLVDKRVRLLEEVSWLAAVRSGNKGGRMKGWQLGTLRFRKTIPQIFHVEFDMVKPNEDGRVFGVGGLGGKVGFLDIVDESQEPLLPGFK